MNRRVLAGPVGLAVLSAALGAWVAPAAAQQWTVEAVAGSTTHAAVAGSAGARSAALGIRHQGPWWAYLSGGLPLDSVGLPWGAGGLGGRVATRERPLGLGVDLAAHGYGYRSDAFAATGTGATLEALPFAALRRGPALLELRSGVLHHSERFDGLTRSRTVHDSGARGSLALSPAVRLGAEARWLRAREGDYPYAGASAQLSLARASAWAHAGRWLSPELDGAAWGVGASIEIGANTSLAAAWQRDPQDPVYWNDARHGWSLALARSLGRRAPAPPPLPVAPSAAGGVVIRLPASAAPAAPSVAGDFTGWEPVAMQRTGDFWTATLALEPGVYRYAFRAPDGSWFVPEGTPGRTEDGFGGYNAVLIVPG